MPTIRLEAPDEAWMVLELREGALAGRQGAVKFQPEFEEATKAAASKIGGGAEVTIRTQSLLTASQKSAQLSCSPKHKSGKKLSEDQTTLVL